MLQRRSVRTWMLRTTNLDGLQTSGNNLRCIGWAPATKPFSFLGKFHTGMGPQDRAFDLMGQIPFTMRASLMMSF
jgi:hypothetical protein